MNNEDNDGEIAFGDYNPERFYGPIRWSPVFNQEPETYFWTVGVNDLRLRAKVNDTTAIEEEYTFASGAVTHALLDSTF
jgi:hypothetical protein